MFVIYQQQIFKFHRKLCPFVIRFYRLCSSDRKRESYFSAIGGKTDIPPPHLSPKQVTEILSSNEITLHKTIKSIKLIECNQLASNHPIEDRLRIARFHLNDKENPDDETIALAVFDGHGGGSCADVISQRLFHYIAISLMPDPKSFSYKTIGNLVENLSLCPNPNDILKHKYDKKAAEFLTNTVSQKEGKALETFSNEIKQSDVSDAIINAFQRCDNDLGQEIEQNLLSSPSNILLHYYLSLAVSGCCVTLMLIHKNTAYIASCGDCKAVLGINESKTGELLLKTIDLSKEHNSDNISELKRVLSSHPKTEQNNVVRNNRLLGQLMPLRAFGDYNYKWTVEKMKKLGLTRAFGSHVIPPYYLTPPYLNATPDIEEMDLLKNDENSLNNNQRFVIMATDGLWELFESTRKVVKCVFKHNKHKKNGQTESDKTNLTEEIKNDLLKLDDYNEDDPFIDKNSATYLIRTALGSDPSADPHDMRQHQRLETYLTLPQSVVRNFRDDISVIVLELE